jgi:imidazoleglycerol phosphate dehydratase HisB
MRREDRQLLSDLAQVNTALPAFALRVMDNTATAAEHHRVADHVIALGQAIDERAETLTIVNPCESDSATDTGDMAVIRALSALVDMVDALDRTKCR